MKKRLINIDRNKFIELFSKVKDWFGKASVFLLLNVFLPFLPSGVFLLCKRIQGFNISLSDLLSEFSLLFYSLSLSALIAYSALREKALSTPTRWFLVFSLLIALSLYIINIALDGMGTLTTTIFKIIIAYTIVIMFVNWYVLHNTQKQPSNSNSIEAIK